jgi:hypothetical protein
MIDMGGINSIPGAALHAFSAAIAALWVDAGLSWLMDPCLAPAVQAAHAQVLHGTAVASAGMALSMGYKNHAVCPGNGRRHGNMAQLPSDLNCYTILSSQAIGYDKGSAHAGHVETSIALALAPDMVGCQRERGFMGRYHEMSSLLFEKGLHAVTTNGVLGDPSGASAEAGENYLDAVFAVVVEHLERQLDEVKR